MLGFGDPASARRAASPAALALWDTAGGAREARDHEIILFMTPAGAVRTPARTLLLQLATGKRVSKTLSVVAGD